LPLLKRTERDNEAPNWKFTSGKERPEEEDAAKKGKSPWAVFAVFVLPPRIFL
jgi:hypothetical protein